jgi:hypothetical protein
MSLPSERPFCPEPSAGETESKHKALIAGDNGDDEVDSAHDTQL